MTDEKETEPPSGTSEGGPPEWLQPTLTMTLVGLAMVVVFGWTAITGVLAGTFTFVDAWYRGIRKRSDIQALTNFSPMGWGIAVILLFLVAYPLYVLNRKRLSTKNGPEIYWWLIHVFAIADIIILVAMIKDSASSFI